MKVTAGPFFCTSNRLDPIARAFRSGLEPLPKESSRCAALVVCVRSSTEGDSLCCALQFPSCYVPEAIMQVTPMRSGPCDRSDARFGCVHFHRCLACCCRVMLQIDIDPANPAAVTMSTTNIFFDLLQPVHLELCCRHLAPCRFFTAPKCHRANVLPLLRPSVRSPSHDADVLSLQMMMAMTIHPPADL